MLKFASDFSSSPLSISPGVSISTFAHLVSRAMQKKKERKFLRPIFTARVFGLGAEAIIGWAIFIKSDFMLSYIALDGGPVGVPCIWLDRHTPAHIGRIILIVATHTHTHTCSYLSG